MCCGWDYILLDYFLGFMKNSMLDDEQLIIVVAVITICAQIIKHLEHFNVVLNF